MTASSVSLANTLTNVKLELALPKSAYICHIEVVNSGTVSGVSNLTVCPTAGGYYDGTNGLSATNGVCGAY